MPDEIVRRILLVALSCYSNGLTCLVTEVDLNLFASLPFLRRLNPELVVPCSRITLCDSFLTMNDEYLVICISWVCFNSSGEGIPTTIIIHKHCSLLRPCANQVVLLLIIEFHVRISPRSLSITHPLVGVFYTRNDRLAVIGEPLLPNNRTLLCLVHKNCHRLPFYGSS